MKQILLLLFFLFSYVASFSQSEKLLHGKILSDKKVLSGIDVVNMSSKKSATTDSNGNFTILVKANDVLFIISKEYTDRKITITQDDLDQPNFNITLEKKPIELDDVSIIKVQSVKIKVSQAQLSGVKIAKEARAPKVLNVYDGSIVNGMDFIKMGKGLINLFKNKDTEKDKIKLPSIPFKEYLSTNFDKDFYVKKLKINVEEIHLFISFCEADSKAKIISEHQNILETMDFLISKNGEFKKLNRSNK